MTKSDWVQEYEAARKELIEKYESRIQFLTERIMYLEGKCEGYKQFWKIWNGESEDEADEQGTDD